MGHGSDQVSIKPLVDTKRSTRRLAADIAGYPRLMGADEEGPIAAFRARL